MITECDEEGDILMKIEDESPQNNSKNYRNEEKVFNRRSDSYN
jgi:hypothetical protein